MSGRAPFGVLALTGLLTLLAFRPAHGGSVTRPPATGTFVQVLHNAPFPCAGKVEDSGVDFFDFVDPLSGQRFHTSLSGERFSEREHYSDGRVLFHLPPQFDCRAPAAYVLYFHALGTDITASNRDNELTRQIDESGANVILVMPQLASHAADSSPGKFSRRGGLRRFMEEVGRVMSERLGGAWRKKLETAPILLTAFSGGYKTAAYVLDRGGVNERVKAVLLMDALYEDVDKFEKWAAGSIRRSCLVSLYTRGSCEENMRELLERLAGRGITAKTGWPRTLSVGEIYHARVETEHLAIPRLGPPKDPLMAFMKLYASSLPIRGKRNR